MGDESEVPGTAGRAESGGKHAACHCEHVSFVMGKYPKMGMDAIVHRLDRLDNAKDGLEEDVAGILDDQSAAEKGMEELRAERDRYRVKPVRTPVAILGSLGVCIYVPASRHWLISYSPIHLN